MLLFLLQGVVMAEEKREKTSNVDGSKLGADVYESAAKFNLQIATKGPAILYALSKADQMINSDVVTGVGGLVVGGIGFFGNRYYRGKGEDSAYSYMGQLMGGAQFITGFLLLTFKAAEIYTNTGEPSQLMGVIKMAGVALAITQSTLILLNSYIYGDAAPQSEPVTSPKLD